jgi:alpha-maltose-1-phosphate synthase
MRVVLSTWGRFHTFHLARQMQRFGWLEAVFTTLPRFVLRNEGIPASKLIVNPWLHPLVLAKWRLGLINPQMDRALLRMVDRSQQHFISRRIPPCDVFIALSGSGLSGGRIVQARAGKWVCDRSSCHQAYADQLMAEEFARFGLEYPRTDSWALNKELREYDAADVIVVPSEFARKSFISEGIDPARVVKIPFGSDLNAFRRTREPDPAAFTVFYCGQVGFRKGIPYLLDAFRRVRHARKKLVIAGAVLPEIKPYLAKADLTDVEFIGVVSRRQLCDLYSGANVFAIASIEEGMAKVQAEAMACGCPVVATENSGAGDLIEDAKEGFIVPIRAPEIIAERLQRLADDSELCARMGVRAREKIGSLGGWDHYGDRYRELCITLTAPAAPRFPQIPFPGQ